MRDNSLIIINQFFRTEKLKAKWDKKSQLKRRQRKLKIKKMRKKEMKQGDGKKLLY